MHLLLLTLIYVIFLMHTCFPPQVLLSKIEYWFLQSKAISSVHFGCSVSLWIPRADLFVSQAAAGIYVAHRSCSSSCNLLNNRTILSLWCVFIESFFFFLSFFFQEERFPKKARFGHWVFKNKHILCFGCDQQPAIVLNKKISKNTASHP